MKTITATSKAILLSLVLSTTAAGSTTLVATDANWYRNTGYQLHYTDYLIAGWEDIGVGLFLNAGYASFSLPDASVLASVTGAFLSLPIARYESSDSSELIRLFDVGTPYADLVRNHTLGTGDGLRPDIYNDLRTGDLYGEVAISARNVGNRLLVPLSQAAVDDIQNSNGTFSIGFSVADAPPGYEQAVTFYSNSAPAATVRLVLVPEPTRIATLAIACGWLLIRRKRHLGSIR